MAKSKAMLEKEIRDKILEIISEALGDYFETDVMPIDASKITLPVVDSEGNEKYAKITVSIARGQRDGNGGYIPYNGYDEAAIYKEERERKAQEKIDKEKERDREKMEKERKREAKKLIKELNEKGLNAMIKEDEQSSFFYYIYVKKLGRPADLTQLLHKKRLTFLFSMI